MSHETTHGPVKQQHSQRIEHVQPGNTSQGIGGTVAGGTVALGEATSCSSLLGSSKRNGRGSAPVRAALLQQMQQSHGNRAVQRYLHDKRGRSTSAASASDKDE